MWQCPQCGEEHEDHFNECWNSSSTTTRPSSTANSATWNPHFPSPLRLRQRLHRRHPRLHAPRRNPRQPPPRTRRLPPGKKTILRRRRKPQITTSHIPPRLLRSAPLTCNPATTLPLFLCLRLDKPVPARCRRWVIPTERSL